MSSTILQIFLLCNVFVIGALTTLGVQHALAHFRPRTKKADKPKPDDAHLPAEMRDKLLEESQANFRSVINHSTAELQHDLTETGAQLNKVLNKLGTAIVGNELERYHADLETIRKQAEASINNAQTELSAHQADLKAKLEAEVAAEKAHLLEQATKDQARLTAQIDTRLGDAMASFLLETLGHNVDLGAQSAYLTAMLEAHKAELKKEVQP